MNELFHILIKTDSTSGLAEIMCGYLRFYSDNRINVTLSGNNRVIHPLAEQVLSEDGIEFEPFIISKTFVHPDLTIIINNNTNSGNIDDPSVKQYNFRNPLLSSDYDQILSDFRTVREEIKKDCIQLVGELQLV